MKIAGWEVPAALLDEVAKNMRKGPFDAAHVRGFAQANNLLPRDRNNDWYIADEIGTRVIAHFKRAGKIEKIDGTRLWKWVAKIERSGSAGGVA
ncbi:hypothetical protein [Paraburkholderia sp. J94]|uniref:hypothetical protein n=1 Tax=Paraburkholderia sp. J94 TaxID=2805441 RepID=UPI002AB11EDB|nr:hypothetical protein [Paraburkholderia sp. J94]